MYRNIIYLKNNNTDESGQLQTVYWHPLLYCLKIESPKSEPITF